MTPDELAAIEARLKASTPGPWLYDISIDTVDGPDGYRLVTVDSANPHRERIQHNKDFIAHAPTDIARLLERVRELEADLQLAKEGLEDIANGVPKHDMRYLGIAMQSRAREILAKLNGGEG